MNKIKNNDSFFENISIISGFVGYIGLIAFNSYLLFWLGLLGSIVFIKDE